MEQEFSYYLENPEKGYVKEIDMRLTGELGKSGNINDGYYYDFNGGQYFKAELDPITGLPLHVADYKDYKAFQGDVYLSWIEFGTNEYEPFSLGKSLGSVYDARGLNKTYKYVYTESGAFNATVVATNTGRKLYKGDGYQSDRRLSYDDYDIKRSTYQLELTVSN